ncbi:hypothetical protein EXN66_Car018653 [Channa argus]|uniref:Uncharacterized protein n=1 Tax=Channa argus TaxID=215402 RepID=A0A6G1QK83_CHAAH|nr:hypothetical protein EXN66_Car018653 [Channa argus]
MYKILCLLSCSHTVPAVPGRYLTPLKVWTMTGLTDPCMTTPFLSEMDRFGPCICLTLANGKPINQGEKKCSPHPLCKCQAWQTSLSDYCGSRDKHI